MQLTLLLVIAAYTSSTTESRQQETVEVPVIRSGYGETCPPKEVRMKARQIIATRVKEIISSTCTVTITYCSTIYLLRNDAAGINFKTFAGWCIKPHLDILGFTTLKT